MADADARGDPPSTGQRVTTQDESREGRAAGRGAVEVRAGEEEARRGWGRLGARRRRRSHIGEKYRERGRACNGDATRRERGARGRSSKKARKSAGRTGRENERAGINGCESSDAMREGG